MNDETENQIIPNGVGSLDVGIGTLLGLTIEAVTTMPTEVKRESDRYLLLRGKDADGYTRRVIIAIAEAAAPAPNDLDMLKDQAGGIAFFTLQEVLTRRLGGSLFNNTGKAKVGATGQVTQEQLSQAIRADGQDHESDSTG